MTGPNAEDRERERDRDRAAADAADAHDDAMVDEAADESFPASDPPSWEPLHSGGPERAPVGRGDASGDEGAPAGLGGSAAFGAHLAGLEERVAAADARGEAVPPEARAMIAHLREIVDALDGLTAALGRQGRAEGTPPPDADASSSAAPRSEPPLS